MSTSRIQVVIPEDVLDDIRELSGKQFPTGTPIPYVVRQLIYTAIALAKGSGANADAVMKGWSDYYESVRKERGTLKYVQLGRPKKT